MFTVTTFGESHGVALGCVVDGCPPGMALSEADIQGDLDRRRPGRNKHTTQRNEPDQVRILSGVFEGKTTGTPIGLLIENTDQRSKDYGDIKDKFRPGHADYTYQQKYGIRDYRGGGRSSARETAMRVAAGAIARKYLKESAGIDVRGFVSQRGSEHRDELSASGFSKNDAGGTLGGISSGQDILASIALKPTSSISRPGKTIDKSGKETEIVTKGRHDPCVGLRATPIAEAMMALVLMDHYLRNRAQNADVESETPEI